MSSTAFLALRNAGPAPVVTPRPIDVAIRRSEDRVAMSTPASRTAASTTTAPAGAMSWRAGSPTTAPSQPPAPSTSDGVRRDLVRSVGQVEQAEQGHGGEADAERQAQAGARCARRAGARRRRPAARRVGRSARRRPARRARCRSRSPPARRRAGRRRGRGGRRPPRRRGRSGRPDGGRAHCASLPRARPGPAAAACPSSACSRAIGASACSTPRCGWPWPYRTNGARTFGHPRRRPSCTDLPTRKGRPDHAHRSVPLRGQQAVASSDRATPP